MARNRYLCQEKYVTKRMGSLILSIASDPFLPEICGPYSACNIPVATSALFYLSLLYTRSFYTQDPSSCEKP